MQSPRVVNGHASSLSGYRDSLINMEIRVGRVHRPTKNTLGAIVIQNRAFVRSRNDLKRPIFLRDVLQKDTEGQHVVVGMRIECPVLVPLDSSPAARRLCVELGCL